MLSAFVLMLFWSRLAAALQPHISTATDLGLASPSRNTVSTQRHAPCLVDGMFAMLHEAMGDDGELTNESLTLFGICKISDNSSRLVLSELAEEIRRNSGEDLDVLSPAAVIVSEEEDGETIRITLDLSRSPLLKPVLTLAFEHPLAGGDLDVTFSSQCLQPNMQSVCVSEGTQYVLLTGKSSEENAEQNWRISVQTKSSDMRQILKDVFIGGESGSNVGMIALLLSSAGKGTDTRRSNVSRSSLASSQTSFLCELRRFLDAVLPQDHTKAPLLQLDSLQSLPPLMLGPSTSETLLAEIINSSAPTIFSFSSWSNMFLFRREQLALSPALLEELRQRLEKTETQVMELIRHEKIPHRAKEKLERLKDLCVFQRNEPAADGESQYCAFLLLKALQTVTNSYDTQRSLRATRADSSSPRRPPVCGLKSLEMPLEKYFLSPQFANINNCQGSCAFPIINTNMSSVNHVFLINSLIEDGRVDVRAPCCVPVAYDPLEVIHWNDKGTFLSHKTDMIAKECGCR